MFIGKTVPISIIRLRLHECRSEIDPTFETDQSHCGIRVNVALLY